MFDPSPYADNLAKLNAHEEAQLQERLSLARTEASKIAKKIAAADASILGIYLFGSTATGNVKSLNFDIDLAIEGGSSALAMEAAASSHFAVDIVDFAQLPSHIKERILLEGIKLL